MTPQKRLRVATPRSKEASSRVYYLITDVTKDQKRAILAHCNKHGISVSKFLAGLAVADARMANHRPADHQEELTVTLKLPPEKHAKLKIFSQRQDKSIEEVLQELLVPYLDRKQTTTNLQLESLRYILSPEDHDLVLKNLKKRGLASRNYVALLALDAIRHKS